MPSRKTVDVQGVKKFANLMLGRKGDEYTPEYRRAVIDMIEHILHYTGNYNGFKHRYSEWDFVNHKLKEGYDDTRREYF